MADYIINNRIPIMGIYDNYDNTGAIVYLLEEVTSDRKRRVWYRVPTTRRSIIVLMDKECY